MTPGVTVTSGAAAPSTSPPTDTGTWFVVGLTERGSSTTHLGPFRSLSAADAVLGGRVSYGVVRDSLETFFKEGGSEAYVGRVVGASPVVATVTAKNGSSENTLKISAASAGAWGNDIDVVITGASSTRTYAVKYLGTVVEESPALETNAAAVSWAAGSDYVRFEDLGKGLAVAATKELASGTDDRENITETHWKNALALFAADLGPGQVSAPGRTTAEGQANVLAHAAAHNRVAVLDGTDTATVGTLTSQADTLQANTNARYGALYAPWVVIPGLTGGTTRTVPPCALIAGLCSRNDANSGNPNAAIAGTNNPARYVEDLSQVAWSEANRTTLSEAGVNVIREVQGAIVPYDDITLVDAVVDDTWALFSNARLNSAISARGEAIGERHLFAQIDGQGVEIAKFNGDLVGEVCLPLYDQGALYGETPEDAFTVDTGESVNTEETKAAGELHADIGVRMSPSARFVNIRITKEAI